MSEFRESPREFACVGFERTFVILRLSDDVHTMKSRPRAVDHKNSSVSGFLLEARDHARNPRLTLQLPRRSDYLYLFVL